MPIYEYECFYGHRLFGDNQHSRLTTIRLPGFRLG